MELPIDVIDRPGLINTVSYEHLAAKGEEGDTVLARVNNVELLTLGTSHSFHKKSRPINIWQWCTGN